MLRSNGLRVGVSIWTMAAQKSRARKPCPVDCSTTPSLVVDAILTPRIHSLWTEELTAPHRSTSSEGVPLSGTGTLA